MDGRTDKRTDRIAISISHVSVLMRDKKGVRVRSRSLEMAPLDRSHMSSY